MKRRGVLALGVASAAILSLAAGTLALLRPGLRERALSSAARQLFYGVSRALLDGSPPAGGQALRAALDDLLIRIEALVDALPPHVRCELSQVLSLLASAPGRRALAAIHEPWDTALVTDLGAHHFCLQRFHRSTASRTAWPRRWPSAGAAVK